MHLDIQLLESKVTIQLIPIYEELWLLSFFLTVLKVLIALSLFGNAS